MPAGYSSLPVRIVDKYTAFLEERFGMGFYPYGLQSDPWRIEYVRANPGYIWRPFIPVGRFEGAGEHPLAKHLTDLSYGFARTYRRIYGMFTGSREEFIPRMNQEMGLYGDSSERFRLQVELAPAAPDIFASVMILECGLALQLEISERDRKLVGKIPPAFKINRGASSTPMQRAAHDDLFGAYFYVQSSEREPLTNAIVRFQSIALALRYPQMRHHAAFYMREMAGMYPPGDALAHRVVEDHLRAAWALIVNEPQLPKYWLKASKYLTTASTLALLNEEQFDPDISGRIDEFQELISRVGQSGEGLQREAPTRHIGFLIKK